MNVSVGRRGHHAFISCDVCGYEATLPEGVTADGVIKAFLKRHPSSGHERVEAPSWGPAGSPASG